MKDYEPLKCCEENQKAKVIVFRLLKRKGTGFYVQHFHKTAWKHSFKYTPAKFCPFCGKELDRLSLFL